MGSAQSMRAWLEGHRLLARLAVSGPPRQIAARWLRARSAGPLPVLLYSQVGWDDVWQRPQELALGLSRHRAVLFCSPVQVHWLAGRLRGRWRPWRVTGGGRLLVASPPILSGEYRLGPVRRLNRVILRRVLEPLFGPAPFLLLTNSPFSGHLVDALRPIRVGYDLIDDFCAFDWAPRDGRDQEDRLIRSAHLAFAGTGSLQRRYSHRLKDLEFLSSGVAFRRITRPSEEPADLSGIPHPRLLYVGTLNDRLDGELIARLAGELGDCQVVLVGPRHGSFRAPAMPGNVHFLGLKPHAALPGYYQHADLGLLPFGSGPAALATNPVKTLEYLAAGLPVLSTPIPDVKALYAPPVVVKEGRDWPQTARAMLGQDDEESRTARREFARGRSWKQLADRVEEKIRQVESELGYTA